MSDKPPKGPGWDNAPGGPAEQVAPDSIATKSEIDRVKQLKGELPKVFKRMQEEGGGRAQRFYPYILVRSILGDHGDRPLNVPFWESPDIWTAPGDPAAAPARPPDHGGSMRAGQRYTIYAHVCNLGRARIAGVRVEFYWIDPNLFWEPHPSYGPGVAPRVGVEPNLIGMTRVDLGPRSSLACHTLVKCPRAWVPAGGGDECIFARASAIGDNISASHPWEAWADRHVAQRNIYVVSARTDVTELLAKLNATLTSDMRVQLLQVGAEAQVTLKIAAPKLNLDPNVQTHVLAELRADRSLHLPSTMAAPVGGHAPAAVTAMAGGHGVAAPFDRPRIIPSAVLRMRPAPGDIQPAGSMELMSRGGGVLDLVRHFDLLSPEMQRQVRQLDPPPVNQAQVLRFTSFRGDQMIGGYTLIIHGA